MNDSPWKAQGSRKAEERSGRAAYSSPRVERQRFTEIVCGGTGRKDDWNFTFNPQDGPPKPPAKPNP